MQTTSNIGAQGVPTWIKILSAIGVVWYGFGLVQFWLGFSMDTAAAVTEGTITAAHASAIEATPIWVWIAFAIASLAGLIGAALFFGGASLARGVFALSLLAAAVYYLWIYFLSGTAGDRPSEELIVGGVVCVVTLAFFLLARKAT